jgi:hypothetical protein
MTREKPMKRRRPPIQRKQQRIKKLLDRKRLMSKSNETLPLQRKRVARSRTNLLPQSKTRKAKARHK